MEWFIPLLIIVIMILLNGIFASYELALASISPGRLKVLVDQKRSGSLAAMRMRDRMEASLAVVQLGITFVGAIAAATGGDTFGEEFKPWLEGLGFGDTLSHVIALGLVVVPLAAVTIVVGELIPKIFALRYPDVVVLRLSPMMRLFALVAFPAVWVLESLTKLAMRSFNQTQEGGSEDLQSSLNELRANVNLLRASRVIGVEQEKIMIGASRLSTQRVRDIMLPAENIVTLDVNASLAENVVAAHLDAHTRFPITERKGDPQAIIGYVNFKEMIFLAKMHPTNPSLREIRRPLISLGADITVSEALRQMVQQHLHLALVRDAGGTVLGMITLEDIFEELVGDIEDEFDRLPRQVAASGRLWILGGGVSVGKLRQVVGRPELAAGVDDETLLNDWLQAGRERPCRGGDVIIKEDLHFIVRKVRRHKVLEAMVETRAPDPVVEIQPPGTP